MFFCFFKVYTCFLRSGYFFYAVPPVRFARRIGLSGGVSAVISIAMRFWWYYKVRNIFWEYANILSVFYVLCVVLCELSDKITARIEKVTQCTHVCSSKTSRPLNKSIFYIRLTALRKEIAFSPALRYTLGWINAPLRSCYSGQPSVPHSSLEGGKGGCSYRRYDGWTQRFAPTWTALSSTLSFRAPPLSFRALSLSFRASAMNLSSSSRDSSRCSEWQGYML